MKIRMGLMVLASTVFADQADAQLRDEQRMEDAGFTMRAANTPEKLAQLRLLPARRMIARSKAGQRYFIYADPDGCKCAMVGDEAALRTYRDMPRALPQPDDVARSGFNPGEVLVHDMDEDTFRSTFPGDLLDFKIN